MQGLAMAEQGPDPDAPTPASPLRPEATIRQTPDDFVVHEIPAYAPSGEGDHVFVHLEKRGLTTLELVRRLAEATDTSKDDIGFAGMKDRHAVTTQWVSIPWREPVDALEPHLVLDDVRVLEVSRHGHKLRTGHLHGNRFTLTLRDLVPGAAAEIADGLRLLAEAGVPNAFGPQRFGRDGTLGEDATAWVRGERRAPKDKRKRRLWFSSFQSLLFNRILSMRQQSNTLTTALVGDLVRKHDTGGMFTVSEEDAPDAAARASAGRLSATGPMFGTKMRWPEGEIAALEREVLASAIGDTDLGPFKRYGEGTRRSLRFMLEELDIRSAEADEHLTVSFVLPKGAYATTVLSEVCRWRDPHRPLR